MRLPSVLLVIALVPACKSESKGSLAKQEAAKVVIPDLTEPQYAPPPLPSAAHAAPTPDAIRKVHAEPIAGVKLGMTEAEVTKILGAPKKKSAIAEVGNAKNEYGMTWQWPTMKAELEGATKTGPFTLRTIEFLEPSKVKTSRGVGIGSTRAEIKAAYPGLEEPIFVQDKRMYVIGAVNGYGMNGISFNFHETDMEEGNLDTDRVKSIEWTGGAEN